MQTVTARSALRQQLMPMSSRMMKLLQLLLSLSCCCCLMLSTTAAEPASVHVADLQVVPWKMLQSVTLMNESHTMGVRPRPQLTCDPKPCLRNVTCVNQGETSGYREYYPPIEWNCTSPFLAYNQRISVVSLSCECHDLCRSNEILVRSCSLTYSIHTIKRSWLRSVLDEESWSNLVMVLLVALMAYCCCCGGGSANKKKKAAAAAAAAAAAPAVNASSTSAASATGSTSNNTAPTSNQEQGQSKPYPTTTAMTSGSMSETSVDVRPLLSPIDCESPTGATAPVRSIFNTYTDPSVYLDAPAVVTIKEPVHVRRWCFN